MKTRTTLILLLAVASLATYVYFFERNRPTSREARENEYTLAQFDETKITGLDITNGDSTIQLRKKSGAWLLTSPVPDRVNIAAITPILTSISDLGRFSTIQKHGKDKASENQKEYGVQKGKVRLKIIGDGVAGEIHLGKDTAFEGKIYARLDSDDEVSVIRSDLRNLLTKDVSEFRDRHLIRAASSEIARVKFKTPAGEIDLERNGTDWTLQTPIKARAANSKVQDLLSNVSNLTISEFIAPEETNLAKYGLAEPRGSISFQAQDSDQWETIEIGSATAQDPEKIQARVPGRPSVFVIPKNLGVALDVKPNDIRDNKLIRVPDDLIDRISIEKPGQPPVVLARTEDHWKFLSDGKPANDTEVQRVIDVVNNTETRAFVDDTAAELPPYGLDQPVLTIKLSSFSTENTAEAAQGETPLATIQFGKTDGDKLYARVVEEPFVVAVPPGILGNISSQKESYEPAKPAASPTP